MGDEVDGLMGWNGRSRREEEEEEEEVLELRCMYIDR